MNWRLYLYVLVVFFSRLQLLYLQFPHLRNNFLKGYNTNNIIKSWFFMLYCHISTVLTQKLSVKNHEGLAWKANLPKSWNFSNAIACQNDHESLRQALTECINLNSWLYMSKVNLQFSSGVVKSILGTVPNYSGNIAISRALQPASCTANSPTCLQTLDYTIIAYMWS